MTQAVQRNVYSNTIYLSLQSIATSTADPSAEIQIHSDIQPERIHLNNPLELPYLLFRTST